MIRFACPTCQKRLVASLEKRGRRARCSGCRSYVYIPYESQLESSTASEDSPEPSRPLSGAFTVEHDVMLAALKQHGPLEPRTSENARVLADIAAAGFATKEGEKYVYKSGLKSSAFGGLFKSRHLVAIFGTLFCVALVIGVTL